MEVHLIDKDGRVRVVVVTVEHIAKAFEYLNSLNPEGK